ncbi:MAG: DUF4382 domain-containing protein, partial [SAR324 cluster bacterium]|nr:DUF4382 domain-containing protein [SAR324 cluster bacterium]
MSAFALLGACGEDDLGSGSLEVRLVDAPSLISGIEAIDIVFDRVAVHRSSSAGGNTAGWAEVLGPGLTQAQRTFDLLSLVNGNFAVLGPIELTEGRYQQMRIVVESATITIYGETADLDISSGEATGLKLSSGFVVEADRVLVVTLDFDAAKSVSEKPAGSENYKLKPVIRVLKTNETGSIAGSMPPPGVAAMVTAFEAGTTFDVTSTHVDPATGSYEIVGLAPGLYDVELTVDGVPGTQKQFDIQVK